MTPSLHFPRALQEQLAEQARAAFPRECCGLIEGVREGARFDALALHATENARPEPDRFEIDPAAHIALLRTLRGTGRAVIGCYHSHPKGRPETSRCDRENGGSRDFVWLIAGIAGTADAVVLGAFAGENFEPVSLISSL